MATGYLSEKLPYAFFVGPEPGILITKDMRLMRVVRVVAKDLSYANDVEIEQVYRVLRQSYKLMEADWSIQIDSIRAERGTAQSYIGPDMPEAAIAFERARPRALGVFYETTFFVSLIQSVGQGDAAKRAMFGEDAKGMLSAQVKEFAQTTDDIIGFYQSAFLEVLPLDNSLTLTFLHSLISTPHYVRSPDHIYLDWLLSDVRFEADTVSKLGDDYVVTASIHSWPEQTLSSMGRAIMDAADFPFRMSTRFVFLSREEAGSAIKRFRKAHFQKRKGVGALVGEIVTKEQSQLEDTEALALTDDANDALAQLGNRDLQFGYLTCTLIVRHKDYKEAKRRLNYLRKVVNDTGFIAKEETLNNPAAFLGSLPGNLKYNSRQPLLSSYNLMHLYPVSRSWSGSTENEHLQEITGVGFSHVMTRTGSSLFRLNLNVGDVGHTLVTGRTGAGKSILLGVLALQFLRYPNSRVVFFDVDASSRWPCQNVGGKFFDVASANTQLRLNPFGDITDPEKDEGQRRWLVEYIAAYLTDKGLTVGPRMLNELREAVEAMRDMDDEHRHWGTFESLVQNDDVRQALMPFSEGEYRNLFSAGRDQMQLARWTTFEMRQAMSLGKDVVQLILGYLFFKLQQRFDGSGPTLLVLDESWSFLDNERFAAVIRDWLKTLRKKHVYCVIATQELADAEGSPIFSTIVNACMTRIFLPNPQALQGNDRRLYEMMGLLEGDIYALASDKVQPKRHYFYQSPKGKQMFELCLDKEQLAILKGPYLGSVDSQGVA